MKNIYVGGCFDILTNAHVYLLRESKKMGDKLIVAVNSDQFILEYKKRPPVCSENERLEIIKAIRYVDDAFIMEKWSDQPGHLLRVNARVIVHGQGWEKDSLIKQLGITKEFMDENNIELKYIPLIPEISSTKIKERVKSQ